MADQDDDDAIAADEAVRIAALQKMAPAIIWLQVDPEGDACSTEWSLLDGATWCSDKINHSDVEYVKADQLHKLQRDLAAEKARQEEMAKRDYLATALRDVFPAAHRLALELECLLLDTEDNVVVSKWWNSAHEALEQWREFLREDASKAAAPTSDQ